MKSFLNDLINTHKRLTLSESQYRYLSLDTETTGLELHHSSRPFTVTTCNDNGSTKIWEWKVNPRTRKVNIPQSQLEELAKHIAGKILIFHNACFDIKALATAGLYLHFSRDDFRSSPFAVRARAMCISFHDTQLASHAIRTSDPRKLKHLALLHLDYSDKDERDLKLQVTEAARKAKKLHPDWQLGYDLKGDRQTDYDYWLPKALDPNDTSNEKYACNDAERTILLWLLYLEQFKKKEFLPSLNCYLREKLLLPTVYKKQEIGITVRRSKIVECHNKLGKVARHYTNEAIKIGANYLCKEDFNPMSSKDNVELLYSRKGFNLPVLHHTPKGNPSTDKTALEKLLDSIKGFSKRLYLRDLLIIRAHKSGQGYLKNYRRYMLQDKTSDYYKLHPSINQVGTATTRYSTSSPNATNVSTKDEIVIGGMIISMPSLRSVFCPSPGKVWYDIDYSQLELRIFAVLAKDKKLIDAFETGEDIHNFVAQEMFPGKEITKELRRTAKAVSFGIIYGKSQANTDKAAGFKGAYKLFVSKFNRLPLIKAELIKFANKHGYVETLFDYQLDVPSDRINTTVIDYICQGTAGDIIKNATIAIDRKGIVDWKHSAILLQVHDELIFEVDDNPKYNNVKFLSSIIHEMEQAGLDVGVKTPVEVKLIKDNWSSGQVVTINKNGITIGASE